MPTEFLLNHPTRTTEPPFQYREIDLPELTDDFEVKGFSDGFVLGSYAYLLRDYDCGDYDSWSSSGTKKIVRVDLATFSEVGS